MGHFHSWPHFIFLFIFFFFISVARADPKVRFEKRLTGSSELRKKLSRGLRYTALIGFQEENLYVLHITGMQMCVILCIHVSEYVWVYSRVYVDFLRLWWSGSLLGRENGDTAWLVNLPQGHATSKGTYYILNEHLQRSFENTVRVIL